MLVYHFTALEYLESIRTEGLTRGQVAVSPAEYRNAVWLTTSGDPSAGHGLSEGRYWTDEEKRLIAAPAELRLVRLNKRAVRIAVRIPRSDRRLAYWPKWARGRVAPDWYERLDETGGDNARSWFLFWGTINPERFVSIDILRRPSADQVPVIAAVMEATGIRVLATTSVS